MGELASWNDTATRRAIVEFVEAAADARSARVERDVDGRKVRIRGSGRLEEVKPAAPDLIRIRADFARRPQPGTLRLFLGRAFEPGERVPSDLRGSTECA